MRINTVLYQARKSECQSVNGIMHLQYLDLYHIKVVLKRHYIKGTRVPIHSP